MSQLLGRVRNKLSGAQADIRCDPHHWRLPSASSYTTPKPASSSTTTTVAATNYGKKKSRPPTLIPDPKVFKNAFIPLDPEAGLSTSSATGTGSGSINSTYNDDVPVYPDVSHAAVHLALLECFHGLRHSADALDFSNLQSCNSQRHAQPQRSQTLPQPPIYSEKPRPLSHVASAPVAGDPEPCGQVAAIGRNWDLLIQLAVDRFGTWWQSIAKVLKHAAAYTYVGHSKAAVQLGENYLPPLDVLLVWYVFMLHGDGDAYASACRDHREVPRLQHLCFPWEALRSAIDTNAQVSNSPSALATAATASLTTTGPVSARTGFAYNLPPAARALFRTLTAQDADVTTYLEKPPPYVEHRSTTVFDGIDLYTEVKKLFEAEPDESSPFAAPSFVDESHALLWIRSPSLVGTLERSSREYFASLLGGQLATLTTVADPSLDSSPAEYRQQPFGIELLWRTHRLYPIQYRLFYEAKLGQVSSGQRLVLAEDATLRGGFDGGFEDDSLQATQTRPPNISTNTSPIVPRKPICQCWTCERIRDDAPDFAYSPAPARTPSWPMSPLQSCSSSSSSLSSASATSSSASSSYPSASVSIPGMSLPRSGGTYDPSSMQLLTADQIRRIQDDVAFYRAVESRRRAGEVLPTRAMTAAEKEEARKAKERRYIPGL